jgi:hypothetical protein
MNLNNLQTLGLLLIVFSLGGQYFLPGATVYYATVAPTMTWLPSGTTPNTPFYLSAYNIYTCTAVLQGIQIGEILSASVQINQWSGTAWNLVGTYALSYQSGGNGLGYTYGFTTGGPGLLYSLSYSVVTTDVGSFQGIGYIQTATLSGYFCIDGILANSTSTLRVTNPILSITYTATAPGIAAMSLTGYVNVLNGSASGNPQIQQITLTPPTITNPNGNLTANYTLPGPGTYILNGFITYSGTTTQQMSIIAPWLTLPGSSSQMSFSDIWITTSIFGVLFIVLGARKKKKQAASS